MTKMPTQATLRRLKLSPEVATYLVERGIPLPDCPPRVKTPEPRRLKSASFDFDRVDAVLNTFHHLEHVAGRWAGQPLDPDPWQVAYIIAPVFGWVRRDKDTGQVVRVIRDLYVDVPRKNGKSTLAAGIALYLACADGEQGAQVVTAATTTNQAKFVFTPIKTLAEKARALRGRVKALAMRVIHPRTGSYIEVISSVAEAQHGANLHGFIVDELHVHKSGELLTTLETGRGSRLQPLGVIITTADSGKPDTVYDQRRSYVERLARGVIRDTSSYGVVWAADPKVDPFAEATQKAANPGFGVSPSRAYLAAEAKKAQNSPAELSSYLRLHLGIRTKQETKYINLATWDRNAGMVDEAALVDRTCYGGLDLASVSDMTALCWLFPDDEGYEAVWRFWVPEAAMESLNDRTADAAGAWVRQGWLRTTPGNVTDYAYVRQAINDDRERFKVETIAYDRWNASQLSTQLLEDGAQMVKLGQGFASLSAPLKEVQRLLLAGTEQTPMLRHGGNPVMRWMIDSLAVATDPAGNVKPDKAKAADKIDGVSALVNAMAEAMVAAAPKESAYASGGLRVM